MSKNELTVKGIGKVSVPPDQIVITMNIEVCETEYEAAMIRGAEVVDKLKAAVESVGHKSKALKTTSFNVSAKYESYKEGEEWKKRFIGYACYHFFKLEFDLDMTVLGKTLDAVSKCEADPEIDIKFTIKNPNAVSEQLLENAVENARQKAVILARAADVNLGAIKTIDYNWGELHVFSQTSYRRQKAVYSSFASMASYDDIEPEDIRVSDNVTIVWEIVSEN